MTNSKFLYEIIQNRNMELSSIAKLLDMSKAILQKKIDNYKPFTNLEIDALCDILDIKCLKLKQMIFLANF